MVKAWPPQHSRQEPKHTHSRPRSLLRALQSKTCSLPPIQGCAAGMQAPEEVLPAPWARATGPPPPRFFTLFTRLLQCACFLLMVGWVFGHLGGLRLSPAPTADGGNDTSQLFNWHPLLMALAFPLLMGEAVLAFKAPLLPARLHDRCASGVWLCGPGQVGGCMAMPWSAASAQQVCCAQLQPEPMPIAPEPTATGP